MVLALSVVEARISGFAPNSSARRLISNLAAALFVLLSAPARAGIVASHLRADPDGFGLFHRGGGFADDVAPLRRTVPRLSGARAGAGAAKGAGGLVGRLLRNVAQEVLESQQAGGAAEDVMADLRLDVDHQLFEDLVRFRLVFDERVPLPVRAQPDAVAQAVHLVEMLLPQLVNRTQDGVALHFLERLGILVADSDFAGLADAVRDEITHRKLRRAEAVEDRALDRLFFAGLRSLADLPFRHADGEIQVHPVGQGAHFPFAVVRLPGGQLLNLLQDNLLHDVHQAVAHIGSVDDFIAEAVNDFALLVHHVVVFQRALEYDDVMN